MCGQRIYEWGKGRGWTPLPTCPQRYCYPSCFDFVILIKCHVRFFTQIICSGLFEIRGLLLKFFILFIHFSCLISDKFFFHLLNVFDSFQRIQSHVLLIIPCFPDYLQLLYIRPCWTTNIYLSFRILFINVSQFAVIVTLTQIGKMLNLHFGWRIWCLPFTGHEFKLKFLNDLSFIKVSCTVGLPTDHQLVRKSVCLCVETKLVNTRASSF